MTKRRVANGSNPAHGMQNAMSTATKSAEVFALLWELSNGWIGLLLSFHLLERLWSRRIGAFGLLGGSENGPGGTARRRSRRAIRMLGWKFFRVCLWWRLTSGMRSGASLRPSNLLSVSGSPWRGSHYALYEHGRGKRAHPIYQRVLAQGRSRARAAYQSCLFLKDAFLE